MDTLESQNDDMIESLSSKVKILKNVCIPKSTWVMVLGDCQNRRGNSGLVKFDGYDGNNPTQPLWGMMRLMVEREFREYKGLSRGDDEKDGQNG